MVGTQWDAILLLWINKAQRVMEKSNYLCLHCCYRKAFECLGSLLETLIELFKKFYIWFLLWILWGEIEERKENSVSSCGLGNQILYILCLWDTRKNNLITFLNKNEIFFSFHLSGRKQKLPVNFCNNPNFSFNRTLNNVIAILLNLQLNIYYSLSITYINL